MEILREQYEKEIVPAMMKKFRLQISYGSTKTRQNSYKYWFR